MNNAKNSFKLIMAGNKNVPAMINAIIQATLQARKNKENDSLSFEQVHIFHTEQSLQALVSEKLAWQEALSHYNISTTSLIHHVTKIEDSSDERFRDLVEQLRTIVNPLNNTNYYVDITGGISSLKTILAVFAYVLDIKDIYSLEIKFSDNYDKKREQEKLFYHELEQLEDIKINYKKFPALREFDKFGKLNYTEVIRHRETINKLTEELTALLPTEFDIKYLRESFFRE